MTDKYQLGLFGVLVYISVLALPDTARAQAAAPGFKSTTPQAGEASSPVFFRTANLKDPQQAIEERIHESKSPLIVWVDDCKYGDLRIKEAPRKSRLATDFDLIIATIKASAMEETLASTNECDSSTPRPKAYTFDLRYKRSDIELSAYQSTADSGDAALARKQLRYGPPEQLYLAIDLPISSRKQLKYDKTSGKLLPTDERSQLYLSLNDSARDLLAAPPTSWLTWERLSGKLLVQASSRPLDSLGLALAYSLPKVNRQFDLEPVTLFFGRFWTREDSIENGLPVTNGTYKASWRAGIAFDVAAALGWFK